MSSLLEVQGLKTWFDTVEGTVRAVDDVSFTLGRSETLALLGESGCGKSITALSLTRLVAPPAGRIVAGQVRLQGQDLLELPESELRRVRGRRIAMIFQEPQSSLNPVLTVGAQVGEALAGPSTEPNRRTRVIELLRAVGIADPARRYHEYPHQLSGGMKQRAMIAMALAARPEVLVADEPTTALDVTIQAQILTLLKELQAQTGMSILLITHDLGVVAEMADRVAVMYAGQIVEQAPRREFFADPQHPYTRKLFRSLPGRMKRGAALDVITGSVPSLAQEFRGCRFAARCEQAWELCHTQAPGWSERTGRGVRCHLYQVTDAGTAAATTPAVAAATAMPVSADGTTLLEVQDLKVHFPIRQGVLQRVVGQVKAVDGVSLQLARGRTLALVGESGCGKTTAGKAILQLLPATTGLVRYDGVEL
ncbi:MAG: ATP-binding cassette domain-containing protein, partial [Pseudomonadota bacterium]